MLVVSAVFRHTISNFLRRGGVSSMTDTEQSLLTLLRHALFGSGSLPLQAGKYRVRNPLIRLRYRQFPRKPLWSKNPPDHMFDHIWRKTQNLNPGLAQLVARLLWEQDVGSSSLPSRTTAPEIERFQGLFSYSLSITVQILRYLHSY